jgi:hypothetical protein
MILDDDHPFSAEPDEPCLALIEGVAAAGELKMVLTADEFILAAESQLTIETVAERTRQIDLETDGQIADALW